MSQVHLLGIFDAASKAAAAAKTLRADRVAGSAETGGAESVMDVTVYAPTFDHGIDAALDRRKSPVRIFTLVGGILGCAAGFAFPIYTVLDWPLITGGKAIVSLPPFVVIAFELTILFAALMTVVGFLASSGLPRLRADRAAALYDPRFSEDRWGVLVTCRTAAADAIRARLEQGGAEEVRRASA
jgi:Alternative complex III, ActD subunit